VDSVSGRPVSLAQVALGAQRPVRVLTGRDGAFGMDVPEGTDTTVVVKRPGYLPVTTTRGDGPLDLTLEPRAGSRSSLEAVIDVVLGAVSWGSLVLAGALGLYMVAQAPGLVTTLIAGFALGLLTANLIGLAHQPHYRWGRVTDPGGVPYAHARVELRDATGTAVSAYDTDQSGRYTLYGEPGHYRLAVLNAQGRQVYQDNVTIDRHPSYLGFKLRLPRL
jgi:hypothetical protein